MSRKDDFRFSRSSRKKGQRFDHFLNWAIAIVVLCILVVGGYLIVSILNTPEQSTAGNQKITHTKKSPKDDASKDMAKNNDKQASDNNGAVTNNDDSTVQGDESTDADATDGSYDTSDGGPEGPWHPIGTIQSEPHQTNYDMGSTDWNERVKAMAYATGIPGDELTVAWLGNGGAPDKSLGKVHSKADPAKVYDVLMQWVANKGWQPISVTVE